MSERKISLKQLFKPAIIQNRFLPRGNDVSSDTTMCNGWIFLSTRKQKHVTTDSWGRHDILCYVWWPVSETCFQRTASLCLQCPGFVRTTKSKTWHAPGRVSTPIFSTGENVTATDNTKRAGRAPMTGRQRATELSRCKPQAEGSPCLTAFANKFFDHTQGEHSSQWQGRQSVRSREWTRQRATQQTDNMKKQTATQYNGGLSGSSITWHERVATARQDTCLVYRGE